ncbi:hypothetical protein [Aerococcus urinaeequi]|uniref:hypothetical protein n=1 Tax=Aerococcus urinaeequi TaxID=51665 RepID=UPI003D6A53CF
MNEKKMSIYHEIHRLHRLGFNKSQIERKVGVNRNTVRKYLAKDFKEMSEWTYTLQNRAKKLDPYADIILEWLKEHSDLSAAQIEDWLLEEYPDLQVGSSTLRSYIKHLRDQYAIPKRKKIRQYEAIPEVEMGAQIQVDWGQTKQKTRSKKKSSCILSLLFYRIAATNILNGWTGPLRHKIPFVRMKMPFVTLAECLKKWFMTKTI